MINVKLTPDAFPIRFEETENDDYHNLQNGATIHNHDLDENLAQTLLFPGASTIHISEAEEDESEVESGDIG